MYFLKKKKNKTKQCFMVPVCLICSTGNFMKDKTMFKKLYSPIVYGILLKIDIF